MAKISTNAEINSLRLAEQASAPDTPASGYGQLYCKSDGLYFKGDGGSEIGPLAAATSAPAFVGVSVYNNADISIASGSHTALTFNTERFDTNAFHDNSTNPSRLTVPSGQAGKYLIIGNANFKATANGRRMLSIRLNGTDMIARQEIGSVADANGVPTMNIAVIWDLAEADYVELVAYHLLGSNLDIAVSNHYSPIFMMQRVG